MTRRAYPCAVVRPAEPAAVHAFRDWQAGQQYQCVTWCGLELDLTPGKDLRSETADRLINCQGCYLASRRAVLGF